MGAGPVVPGPRLPEPPPPKYPVGPTVGVHVGCAGEGIPGANTGAGNEGNALASPPLTRSVVTGPPSPEPPPPPPRVSDPGASLDGGPNPGNP